MTNCPMRSWRNTIFFYYWEFCELSVMWLLVACRCVDHGRDCVNRLSKKSVTARDGPCLAFPVEQPLLSRFVTSETHSNCCGRNLIPPVWSFASWRNASPYTLHATWPMISMWNSFLEIGLLRALLREEELNMKIHPDLFNLNTWCVQKIT